nr:uncharacterized mitochondrial protein AtMg00810-like [Tanacetum cinerariifolium]
MLDTGKFEQWQFRIQQYLQHEHYALWEVIEFDDSYKAPTNSGRVDSIRKDAEQSGRTITLTTDDIQKKKNDVKARTTLLLSLPDEHQLRFSKYKTAKELWAAILKTFGGNEATKKRKKNILKQQYGNFKAEGIETLDQTFNILQVIVSQLQNDLDSMSLDDLYNHLKVYEAEVHKKSNSNSQDMAFISSSKNSSNEDDNIVRIMRSWSDKLDDALWAFRTAYKTPIGCTPYKLVYGKPCYLPVELEHKAYWALKYANFDLKTAGDHRKVYPYGTVELSQPDGPNFKVNGHRLKHYFGEDYSQNLKTHAEGFCPPSLDFLSFIRESLSDEDSNNGGGVIGDPTGGVAGGDDIIFGSTKKSLCTEFDGMMHKKFLISFMGELTFFLGLQVMQRDDGIFISQDKYVADILNKFNFYLVKTASTPIETNKALLKDEEAEDVDVHVYRSMIGSFMYLTASRLDIMFAICACARFQVTPKVSHLHAVKRIFIYLKGQPIIEPLVSS